MCRVSLCPAPCACCWLQPELLQLQSHVRLTLQPGLNSHHCCLVLLRAKNAVRSRQGPAQPLACPQQQRVKRCCLPLLQLAWLVADAGTVCVHILEQVLHHLWVSSCSDDAGRDMLMLSVDACVLREIVAGWYGAVCGA